MERSRDNFGQFARTEVIFICEDCTFTCTNRKTAFNHRSRLRHDIHPEDRQPGASNEVTTAASQPQVESGSNPELTRSTEDVSASFPSDPVYEEMTIDPHDCPRETDENSDNCPPEEDRDCNKWYPFDSHLHFVLCFLYSGSHNHKITQQVLKVLLLAFEEYSEEVPTLDSIIHFKNEFWEERLLRKVPFKQSEFSFLNPWGILAMRAGNPLWTHFDCFPQDPGFLSNESGVRTGQSSGEKWLTKFSPNSIVLNDRVIYRGDTFQVICRGDTSRFDQIVYVRIDSFFQSEGVVFARLHKYTDEDNLTQGQSTLSDHSHVLKLAPVVTNGKHNSDNMQIEKFKDVYSIREQKFSGELSKLKCVKTGDNPYEIEDIVESDSFPIPSVEQTLLENGHSQVTAVNLHFDDTSANPQSKVWKSATCISLQLAGAPTGSQGWKHGDGGTVLIAVSPSKEMSETEMLNCMREDFDQMQKGFEAYDLKSNKVEKIAAGVAVAEADLEATRELTPFKGASGFSFCTRDNMTVETTIEEEESLVPRTRIELETQMEEIRSCTTAAAKLALCKSYGIVPDRYPPTSDMFHEFSLFEDFGCDTLHLVLLGIDKKYVVALKNYVTEDKLKRAAAVVESVMTPVVYKNKPSSSVVLSPASQIGRSFKALLQVLYYALDLAGFEQHISRSGFNLAELNKYLFSESDPFWTNDDKQKLLLAINRTMTALERYFPEVISPKSHYVKHHVMQDLENHGHPSSFSCQGGERKMKVQKIAQQYSNKTNTNRDVTKKVLAVEIVRHIVTGGVLNDNGDTCSEAVQVFARKLVCQEYLGLKSPHKGVTVKLGDYSSKRLLKSRPLPIHVEAGCPDLESTTWRRILIDGEKIVRGSGATYKQTEGGSEDVGIVQQIYRNVRGTFVIISPLVRTLCEDQFLSYTEQKVYGKLSSCILINNIKTLKVHVLLHACKLESEKHCRFTSEQGKIKYKCIGEKGSTFFHNSCALTKNN